MSVPRRHEPFHPNHIVLLAPITTTPVVKISDDGDDDDDDAEDADLLEYDDKNVTETSDDDDAEDADLLEYDVTETISPPVNPDDDDKNVTETSDDDDNKKEVNGPGVSLPHSSGLTTSEVLNILLGPTPSRVVYSRVPPRPKDNVYFLVDNAKNAQRRIDGRNNVFDDDCGAWTSSTARSIKHPYMMVDNKPIRMFWVASMKKYCREKK